MIATGAKNATKQAARDNTTEIDKPKKPDGPRPGSIPAGHWGENFGHSLRVSATDLRRYTECPLSVWYSRQEPFETAAPTLGLAVGEIVHVCRALLSSGAWGRYASAKEPADLWSPEIEGEQRLAIDSAFDRHAYLPVFGEVGRSARSEYTALLLGLERQRALRAANLLRGGIHGQQLASAVLPVEIELPLCDFERGLVGVCDEVWWEGGVYLPVELKTSPPTTVHREANRVQVAAYASMLTQSAGCEVRECRVNYLGHNVVDVFRYDRSWSRKIDRLTREVRRVRSDPVSPAGRPSREVCGYCPFQTICTESEAPGVLETIDAWFERGCPA
jgi:CRISPR-associated protein Cas4